MDITRALAGFQARFEVAWQAGYSALDAIRSDAIRSDATQLDADEGTVSHIDWAMSNQARFRLRVFDGEKRPGDPGHSRPTSSVGTVDEADPRRVPLVIALRELEAYFDAGLGLTNWDWSVGPPSGWLETAAELPTGPQPWDLPGPKPPGIQPMRWRRHAERAADPAHPDRAAIEKSAGHLAQLFGSARRQAADRSGSRPSRTVARPLGVDPLQALTRAHGDVVSGDWYPGSLFPLLDVRLRVILEQRRLQKKVRGAGLHRALDEYTSFVEQQRFGLPAWPWSAGPPISWSAAALRATADAV